MYLSGSMKEMRNILMAASDLKADGIHFLTPNRIFILAGNRRDYIFLETPLFIASSVYIPRSSYSNIHIYIKATRPAYRNTQSPFYKHAVSNLEVWSQGIRFDNSELLSIEAEFISVPIKKSVELKILDSMQSSFTLDTPFLAIPAEKISEIHAALATNKSRYINRTLKSEDNIIRFDGEQLTLFLSNNGKESSVPLDIPNFSYNELFTAKQYTFSDKAFYLFKWLSLTTPIDELLIIPRSDYCILEGYQDGMCIKVRTNIRNDHIEQKV